MFNEPTRLSLSSPPNQPTTAMRTRRIVPRTVTRNGLWMCSGHLVDDGHLAAGSGQALGDRHEADAQHDQRRCIPRQENECRGEHNEPDVHDVRQRNDDRLVSLRLLDPRPVERVGHADQTPIRTISRTPTETLSLTRPPRPRVYQRGRHDP